VNRGPKWTVDRGGGEWIVDCSGKRARGQRERGSKETCMVTSSM